MLYFLPNFAQNFLYTQNDQTKQKNLLNAQKWEFSSQIDSGVFV